VLPVLRRRGVRCPVRWLNRTIVLVSLTSLLTDVSSEMVYPLMPLFLTGVLHASTSVLGLVEGIAESVASFAKIGGGWWSDRIGKRKPLAVAGYAASAVGKLLIYLSTGWGLFLTGRVGDRIGKGVRNPPRDALISETVPHGQLGHAFGFHRMMDTAGAAMGVIAAYFLFRRLSPDGGGQPEAGAFYKVFLVSLVPAVLGVVVIMLVSEPKHAKHERPTMRLRLSWKSFRSLPGRLQVFLGITAVFSLGNSSNQFLLLYAHEALGYPDSTIVLLYLVYNVVYAAAAFPAGRLSDRVGKRRMLGVGYAAYGLVYLGFAFVGMETAWAAWGLFAIYGLYMGLTEGNEKALVAQLAPKDQKATVLGLHAAIVGLGLLPASVIAGQLWDHVGAPAPFVLGGVLGLIASGALWAALRDV